MTITLQHDLRISGALTAGNIETGRDEITPVASTPTSVAVTGLNLQGAGTICVFTTPHTSAPGTRVIETSFSSPSATGFTMWIYRTTDFPTLIHWVAARKRV